jgi:hypothetical protein
MVYNTQNYWVFGLCSKLENTTFRKLHLFPSSGEGWEHTLLGRLERANLNHWDSAVGIATGYGLSDRGIEVRVKVGARIFTSTCHPHRFWGPPSLLSMGNGGSFPGGKAAGA